MTMNASSMINDDNNSVLQMIGNDYERVFLLLIIIYHDFLPAPRRGSHVKSGKTHTQSSTYTP